ncbi:uncharacterized protein Dvir_GJ25667 [Drosophila virilis]|uniref:Uncharacterized protein n=1 Tax=Drosophila virilis TaxID=7244 RepID=A0A0Q9VZ73_DROVI|nr:uncharacterized protein Dvir_GJ25667 [Drosophila virilis]
MEKSDKSKKVRQRSQEDNKESVIKDHKAHDENTPCPSLTKDAKSNEISDKQCLSDEKSKITGERSKVEQEKENSDKKTEACSGKSVIPVSQEVKDKKNLFPKREAMVSKDLKEKQHESMLSPSLKKDTEAKDIDLKRMKEETRVSDTIVVSQEEAKEASSIITDAMGVQETSQPTTLPSTSVEDAIPNTRREQISNESNSTVLGTDTDVIEQKNHIEQKSKVDQKETEKENKKLLQHENPLKVNGAEKIPVTTTEENSKTNDKKRTNLNAQKGKQKKPGLANETQPKTKQQKEKDDKLKSSDDITVEKLRSPKVSEIADTEKEDQTMSANVKTIEKASSDTTTKSNSLSGLVSDTQNEKELCATLKSDSYPKLLEKQIKDISACRQTVKKEIDQEVNPEMKIEKEERKGISLNEKCQLSQMPKDEQQTIKMERKAVAAEAKKDNTIRSDLKRKLKVDDQKEREQNNTESKKLKLMDDKNKEQTQPQQPKSIQMPIIKGNEKTLDMKVAIEAPQTTKKEQDTKAKKNLKNKIRKKR